MSLWCHSRQESYVQCKFEETNYVLIIQPLYHQSHSTYILLICSKLNSAAPAWQPWLSATNLYSLDHLQNHYLQLIIGQLVSTPLTALCLEADVQSYHTCSNHLILRAQEKALHSTNNPPKYFALAADIPQCLQNCGNFLLKANDTSTLFLAQFQHHQTIKHFPSASWQLSTPCRKQISTSVPGITSQADNIDLNR